MNARHITVVSHALDFWLARGAILLITGLQLLFINQNLIMGPRWLAPAVEIAMLIPLSAATVITQNRARRATEAHHWVQVERIRRWTRALSLILTAAVMIINFDALWSVTRALTRGGHAPSGQALLIDALNIWFTNVVIFALWFWTLDRGGPAAKGLSENERPDFLFPQMMGAGDQDPAWSPGFLDYVYVSFTNATAFSPTDTMPLTGRIKMLMAIEAFVSLLTVGLVAARAVNILT